MRVPFAQATYNTYRSTLDNYLKNYWNNHWGKNNVFYKARGTDTIPIQDILNDSFSEVLNQFKDLTNDEKAKAVLQWTHNNITYVGDFQKWKKAEVWQYASETWQTKSGDCEDGAILMYKLLRNLGVPSFRLKLCAGEVSDGENIVGHCYLIYLSEVYNEWHILDWCYHYQASLDSLFDIPHKLLNCYQHIWWTFNEDNMWSQHEMEI